MKEKWTAQPLRFLSAVLLLAAAFGCSTSNETGGLNLVDANGNHPANFLSTHPGFALSSVDQCKSCHGDDLTGGIARTSCFASACHHDTKPGWASPGGHGAAAKKAPGSSGFASCRICHGNDFAGGGSGVSCLNNAACHGSGINSPHSRRPWRLTGTGNTHTNTDPLNAVVCAGCHAGGANTDPPHPPPAPAPAGTPPGCFNSTLCHGVEAAPHSLGATWRDPTSASFHGLEAKKNLVFCQACHGTPGTILFDGGAASTKCSTCHTSAKAHPATWYPAPVVAFPGYVPSHRDALNKDTTCSVCHDFTQGRTPPNPAAPSCFSASYANAEHASVGCHAGGPGAPNHAVPFLATTHTQATPTTFSGDCSNCHAVDGSSPVSSAPLCTICHQAGSPLTLGGCASCHARPPSGTTFPNVAGRHAEHDALAGVTGNCANCHNGLDSGSQAHYDRANARPGKDALRVSPGDANFLATFNAKSGAASFDNLALTCSRVSCHGGLTTPSWQTGTIDVSIDAGCRQCHALGTALGTPENNSPFSGLHSFHLGGSVNALCTECHDMANGTDGALNHFKFLNTPQMEGPAGQTVAPLGVAANYNAQGQTCGTFTCHGQLHDAFSWSGGANHSVPFLSTAHTAVTQSGFDAVCDACHAVTGTSPLSSAPLCTVCHQAGSPLTLGGCASCHARPPSGTAFPNIAGRHAKHNALAGVTGICSSCHDTFDSGTLSHYDHANARPGKDAQRVPPGEVKFLAAYNAKTGGAASFTVSTLACSNVSCHGGQTIDWNTATVSVDADCTKCHRSRAASDQFNSYFSGRHDLHILDKFPNDRPDIVPTCVGCHDAVRLAPGHFTNLASTGFEQPPSATLRTGLQFNGTTCNPGSGGINGCHGQETW